MSQVSNLQQLQDNLTVITNLIFVAISISSDAIDLSKPSNNAYKDSLGTTNIVFPLDV